MKLSQLIESFVISNDEFEDYLNRATEQLVSELSSGKNPRDAVHDLALTFADQHNKSYDAYQRMADSLEARMHTLEMNSPTDMMNGPEDDMGMGSVDEPEMMSDPMGNMEMNTPASSEMPSDSDMEDYSAVMGEGRMSDQLIDDAENMTKKEFEKKHGKEAARDMFDESVNEHSDTEKARQRALAKADEPERGEERKKVSLKKAPWEESVNEAAECKYCGGDCPNDEEHACDGYLGDIDGLYEAGPEANEDAGKVGYMEMFFTDRDGGEVSHEVEVTLKDGKLSITGNMPGPEDDLYYDESDIEEQLRDAMQDMSVISWMNEDITEDPSKPNFPQTVELAGDSIWDRETPNPKTVTVTDYEMEADKDGYVHVKVMHDGPWTIYTDTGFEKAISEMIGMKVSFTEQGMQEEGVASLESGDDMDEDISILKRNAGVA